jgi:erythromycin esterase-like protein
MAQNQQLGIRAIGAHAEAVTGARRDFDRLKNFLGDSRFVLLGEASNGTHDFYHTRVQITQWLIEKKAFTAVAAEADWPDAHRANRYVQGRGENEDAVETLGAMTS